LSGSADHLWVISSTSDPDGKSTHVDQQWLVLTGQTPAEAIGYGWLDAVHPEDRPDLIEALQATLGRHEALRHEFRVRGKDGRDRWALGVAAPRFDEEGKFLGYVASLVDIQSSRDIEESLRKSEEQLRSAHERLTATLRASPVIVFEQGGPDLRYRWILNPPPGLRAEDIIGKTDREFLSGEDAEKLGALKRRAIETGASAREEVRVTVRDAPRWYDLSIEPHRAGDAIDGVLCTATDITERREADRRKDEFLAILGHELRNPLTPIQNGVQAIKRALRPDASDSERSLVDMMQRQTAYLVRLVDDLLQVARVNSGVIELRRGRVDLTAAVQDALEVVGPLIEKKGHAVTTRLPAEALIVNGDPMRLAQIVTNLVSNAAKYTPPGGGIEILAERRDGEAAIRVRDNGVGIEAEALPRIFDLFARIEGPGATAGGKAAGSLSEAGLGVGLTLARKLAALHGGTIEAASGGLGQGAEFTVTLPLEEAAPAETERQGEASPEAARALRLMVIDDNHDVADSMAMLLESFGAEIRVAYDGVAGVEAAVDFRPDLAFVDIRMPGVDGYETARRMRERLGPAAPRLIALSGIGDGQASREAGFDIHLTKPVSMDTLEALLNEAAG
jgi:PAS domain S-box-containing protein